MDTYMTSATAGFTRANMEAAQPAVTPEIKGQVEQLEEALGNASATFALLEEKLGYITTPQPPRDKGVSNDPQPNRSPLAHTVACMVTDVRNLIGRTEAMYRNIEI